MRILLLAVDVGNTNITLGIFKEDELLANYRMTTAIPRTSDEYGIFIRDILRINEIKKEEIKDAIIGSVVPNMMWALTSGIIKYLDINPIIVGVGTKTGIKIITGNPKEIGTDRIIDAVGAIEIYGGPAIVIDFGTATTYDLILEDGSFAAGITSPGIRISANALWRETAKLPEILIEKPKSILAKDTVTSMQAGLIYGCIGQTEYIINKMKEESGISDIKVIATGGLGKIISDSTDAIDIYNKDLTMYGLKYIYNKNKFSEQ